MTVTGTTAAQWPQIERFLRRAAHLYADTGSEDLLGLIRSHVAIVGHDGDDLWGLLALQIEPRPSTLPEDAPDRVFLRFIALTRGRSPVVDIRALVDQALPQIAGRGSRVQMQAYGRERWVIAPLLAAGFTIAERIEFLRLTSLQQRSLPAASPVERVYTRAATPDDLALLARLDARSFPPRWHFDEQALFTLLLSGRVQLAAVDDLVVGYWALTLGTDHDAHLSRLAVHPNFQGRGIGRHLLVDAMAYARKERYQALLLNTQSDNQSAQSLYRSVGFRPTGKIVPILTYQIRP